jgi:hypothetical protein
VFHSVFWRYPRRGFGSLFFIIPSLTKASSGSCAFCNYPLDTRPPFSSTTGSGVSHQLGRVFAMNLARQILVHRAFMWMTVIVLGMIVILLAERSYQAWVNRTAGPTFEAVERTV